MSDSTVVLRIGPSKPDFDETPAQSIVPVIDARDSKSPDPPGTMLNQLFTEIEDGVEWVIIVPAATTIDSSTLKAFEAEIEQAASTIGCIVASPAGEVPFERWSTFPMPAAALIPGCGSPFHVAVRRNSGEPFNDVSDPIRDRVIRSAITKCLSVATYQSDSVNGAADDRLPSLYPDHPGNNHRWLAAHLEQVSDAELFPDIESPADAVAFRAGLWQMHDDLSTSHEHSQSVEGKGRHACGDYWHAIMHRREPDPSNSKYWYRRVGEHAVFASLADHAATILDASDSTSTAPWNQKLISGGNWDPFAFVDFCEEAARSNDRQFIRVAEQIQWIEMMLLLNATYRDATGR